MYELWQEELNLLIAEGAQLGAEDILDADMVRISSEGLVCQHKA